MLQILSKLAKNICVIVRYILSCCSFLFLGAYFSGHINTLVGRIIFFKKSAYNYISVVFVQELNFNFSYSFCTAVTSISVLVIIFLLKFSRFRIFIPI